MPLSIGEGPDGKPKVVAVDEDGRVQVDASIATPDGPIGVVIAEQQTATALPEPGASGLVTHIVPTGPQDPEASLAVVISNAELQIAGTTTIATRQRGATTAGNPTSRIIDADVRALDVTAVGGATEAKQDAAIGVGQGIAAKLPTLVDNQIPVVVPGVEGAVASLEAEVADDATTSDVQEVRDRLPPALGGAGGLNIEQAPGAAPFSVDTGLSASGSLATEAKQDAGNASLASLDGKAPALVSGRVPVDGSGVTQPISGTVSETNSATIATNTGRIPTQGQALAAASMPVVLPLSQAAGALALQAQLPAALGAGGGVKIDGSGTPLPVNGTVTANMQVSSAAVSLSNPVPTRSTATELAPAYVRLPQDGFGRTVTVEPTPVIEAGFCYGAPVDTWTSYTTLTGTVTTTALTSSLGSASTGASASSVASLFTLARHSYRAGQALRLDMTTLFSTPAVGGFQVVGVGVDDGYAVGYNGTAFGFLRRSGGRPEIRTLTITTASTTNENVTVTLDGVTKLVAVTNSGNAVTTAREISAADYSTTGAGWDAYQLGATVIFASRRAAPRSGSYSLTATTAVGSYAQTIAGVTPTDTWVAKTAWNGDRLDGSLGANNASGATLDPTKLSVWQILIPFLGAGNVILQWQDPTTGQWTTCHTIQYPNTATEPTVKNPTFVLWIEASGAANISASCGSIALFADGKTLPVGSRIPVPPVFKTTVGNGSELPIVSVRAERVYNGAPNRSGFKPLQLTASAAATGQVMLRFYRNATLTGYNFGLVNAISPISYDSSATAASGGFMIGDTVTSPNGGSTPISLAELGYSLNPGDVITVTAQQTNGTNGTVCVTASGYHDNGNGTGL